MTFERGGRWWCECFIGGYLLWFSHTHLESEKDQISSEQQEPPCQNASAEDSALCVQPVELGISPVG